MTNWTTLQTKHLIRDRWLALRSDTCRTAANAMVDPYYVLEYPDWVNVFAISDTGEVLLVKQYRHARGVESLELPCGSVDPSDATSEVAARRELLEETGYQARSFTQYAEYSPNPATHTNLVRSYLALDLQFVGSPGCAETEDLQVLKWPVKRLLESTLNGEIIQSMHVAAVLLACQNPAVRRFL